MTYSFTLRWFTAGALALVACNGTKSLGEYDTDDGSGDGDGSGGDGSGDDAGSASASASASGTSATATGGQTASDSGGADAETGDATADTADDDDTGSPGACEGEGNCVQFPISCDDVECGGTSVFDADGCVRTACTSQPDACGDGEFCYRAMDFGGCQSSAVGCVDDESTMSCQCGSLPDCGGAYCLPEADWPAADPGPEGGAHVRDSCAPNDGPAFELRFGLDSSACDASQQPTEPYVAIRIDALGPAPGTYAFGDGLDGEGRYDAGDGNLVTASFGWVTIDAVDADSVSGTYRIVISEVAHLSADFDVPLCDSGMPCG
jgi:hypothetical protein